MGESPAGIIEEKEEGKETAARELVEETGYKAKTIEEIINYYSSPGYSDELVFIYKATNIKYVGDDPDDEEEFEVSVMSLNEANNLINKGEIVDAKTIIAIQYLLNERTR